MDFSKTRAAAYAKIQQVYNTLPLIRPLKNRSCICGRCLYVNSGENHFCTNCGAALDEGNSGLLYQFRVKQRQEMLKKSNYAVQLARIVLYIMAACCTVGIGFLFGNLEGKLVYAILSLTGCAMFFLLGRWSLQKPFTALLTAFVIMLTFTTISVFGQFIYTFTSVPGIYTIFFCLVVLYFLLKGVQAAYKADLLQEEMQVN